MKRIIMQSPEDVAGAVEEAIAVLRNGGIILYPTDTIYGLGADALSDDAVAKIYTIKNREIEKQILCIVSDFEMLQSVGLSDQRAELLSDAFFPGPLTLILRKHPRVMTGVGRDATTIGVRIPDNNFCVALTETFEGPITSTSANISGQETLRTVDDIVAQLGDGARHIDLIIDAGRLPRSQPSTIVKLSGGRTDVLREGPISTEDIMSVLE